MRNFCVAVVLSCVFFYPSLLFSSGYLNPDIGAAALGMGISVVAKADDLSAVYHNPAGLTQLDGYHFLVSPRYINLDSEYTYPGASTAVSDESAWVGFLGFSTDFNRDDLVFGIGVYSPFGLKIDWPDKGAQRYSTTGVDLKTVYFTPSLAYQINDRFSIGGGFSIIYAEADLQKTTNPGFATNPTDIDPRLDIKTSMEGDDVGFGGDLGVRVKLHEQVTWGLMYISEVNVDLEGDFNARIPPALQPTFGGLSKISDKGVISLKMPHQIRTGVYFEPTEQFGLEFDFNWVNWASNDKIVFDFDNTTPITAQDVETPRKWDDSITIRLGAEYKVSENYIIRGGYIFDQTPIPDKTLDPIVPDADKHGICGGFGYRRDELMFDLAYVYFAYSDRDIDNSIHLPPTNGAYASTIQMITFSFGVAF